MTDVVGDPRPGIIPLTKKRRNRPFTPPNQQLTKLPPNPSDKISNDGGVRSKMQNKSHYRGKKNQKCENEPKPDLTRAESATSRPISHHGNAPCLACDMLPSTLRVAADQTVARRASLTKITLAA